MMKKIEERKKAAKEKLLKDIKNEKIIMTKHDSLDGSYQISFDITMVNICFDAYHENDKETVMLTNKKMSVAFVNVDVFQKLFDNMRII
jgi:hypothetical protein